MENVGCCITKVKNYTGMKNDGVCMHSRKPSICVCQRKALSYSALGKCHKFYSSNSSDIICCFLLKSVVINSLIAQLNIYHCESVKVSDETKIFKNSSVQSPDLFTDSDSPMRRGRVLLSQWNKPPSCSPAGGSEIETNIFFFQENCNWSALTIAIPQTLLNIPSLNRMKGTNSGA